MYHIQCCRTCLSIENLNLIYPLPEHSEKYTEVIFSTTGIKVEMNDSLSQHMCATCIIFINKSYNFRKKCQNAEKSLLERLNQNHLYEIKIEQTFSSSEVPTSIDITDLIIDSEFRDYDDNITLNDYYIEIEKNKQHNIISNILEIDNNAHLIIAEHSNTSDKQSQIKEVVSLDKCSKKNDKEVKKRGRTKKENQEDKKSSNKKERVKEEIKCELCQKVLTSRLSLRNHNKIHTGFDVVCEHCGKRFITRRLLLMHCKAKHGYEKTDKCSYCSYTASNAEQVKIHERIHTGEKPYVCSSCGAGFHRKSSYLQHVAIHLPDKTVQCDQCPARFKSVTLMRIHRSRHRAPKYTYKCRVCDNTFARRRNVVRHLSRIHSLTAESEHIVRTKCT